ncbi:hypothetical protein Q3G72_018559 [Acer saccharum]|nr:hypothetical protein Q3G72_018559 [Acer saccharum]
MSQGFVFSAECEREKNEVVKEKPPDPKSSMKRARGLIDEGEDFLRKTSGGSFKSKLLGMAGPSSWEGFGAVKEKLKIADGDGGVFEVTEAEPFGPWMQVSYRKKSMTTVGTKTLNMKTGNSGIVLDNGVDSMNNIQPPSNGAEEFDTGYEARHGMGKVGKGGSSRSAVKQGNKAIGRSRFEILSGDAEQNFGVLTNQNKSAKQIQSDSCKVLGEISNTGNSNNKQRPSQANKYVESSHLSKNRFNKPFKENVTREGSRSLGSVTSTVKKDMNRNPNQSICMEEEKELHQQMRDSVSTDKGTSLDIIENCGSECMEQVDLLAVINIEEVASKLKEAMEVVLE